MNNSYSWNRSTYSNPTPPRNTNVILVTGPDEAVMRTPNDADMLYVDQNRPILYRVVADMWGRKSLAEIPFSVPTSDSKLEVTRAEFDELVAKVNALTTSVPKEDSKNE